MTRTIHLACIWSALVFVVLFGVGLIPLAHFVPPPSPTETADQIAALYRSHTTGIRIGMVIAQIGACLVVPWGVGIAVLTGRIRGVPIALPLLQIVAMILNVMLAILGTVFWLGAAFRPDAVAAETTRVVNDLGWFLMILPSTPMTMWEVGIGVAILMDQSEKPTFPRWAGYLVLCGAFVVIPSILIGLFKTGPFAWTGLLGFYVPLGEFFICLTTLSILAIKAIHREDPEEAGLSLDAATV